MITLHTMVVRAFLPVFIGAMMFFILILQLVDLFANLWRYINNDVTIAQMGVVALYYIPKCIAFSVPIASLFAVSFCLGNFQANNELISLFGSGISLRRFSLPFLFFGLIMSIGGFYFEDHLVIDTYRQKNELSRQFLNESQSFSKSRPTVMSGNNRIIYHAEYFNDNSLTLSDLTVLERDEEGRFIRRIDADWAEWSEDRWILHDARLYFYSGEGDAPETRSITEEFHPRYDDGGLDAPPGNFRKTVRDVAEMPIGEAREWIDTLIKSGLPFREPLTDYYRRFSFALTPFVVVLLSAALGGRFKKNILLMSLLTSLSVSVVYYVMQMITVIMSNHGYISPLAGAWTPFIFFSLGGIVLFRYARS